MLRRQFLKVLGLVPAAAVITACPQEDPLFKLDESLPEETPVATNLPPFAEIERTLPKPWSGRRFVILENGQWRNVTLARFEVWLSENEVHRL